MNSKGWRNVGTPLVARYFNDLRSVVPTQGGLFLSGNRAHNPFDGHDIVVMARDMELGFEGMSLVCFAAMGAALYVAHLGEWCGVSKAPHG